LWEARKQAKPLDAAAQSKDADLRHTAVFPTKVYNVPGVFTTWKKVHLQTIRSRATSTFKTLKKAEAFVA